MMPPPVDQAARDRIRTDLGHSFFVEASAGTGKTTEIVHRIVAVLGSGAATVNSIVVVTFTARAAGELKLRLRGALEHARQNATAAAEKEALERALSHLEEARVSTIHSFCSDVLSERPVEAGIDPSFAMLPDAEAEQLFSIAFTGWMEERLGNPTPALRRVLRRTPKGRGVTEMLRRGGWDLAEWRDCRTPWEIQAFDRAPAIDVLVQHVHAFADVLRSNRTDTLAWSLRDAMALSDHITRTETVRPRDIDELEGRFIALADSYFFHHPLKGRGPQFAPGISRQTVHQEHARFCAALEVFRDQANAELAPYLQRELMETLNRYAALKAERGVLDFTDLILRARDLRRGRRHGRRHLLRYGRQRHGRCGGPTRLRQVHVLLGRSAGQRLGPVHPPGRHDRRRAHRDELRSVERDYHDADRSLHQPQSRHLHSVQIRLVRVEHRFSGQGQRRLSNGGRCRRE
jgi:ATP-dependent exoDNAse (exonuclease V) beta subunit